jgi:hypothetical protein
MMLVMIRPDMERTPAMDMIQAMNNRPDLEAIEPFNPLHQSARTISLANILVRHRNKTISMACHRFDPLPLALGCRQDLRLSDTMAIAAAAITSSNNMQGDQAMAAMQGMIQRQVIQSHSGLG